MEQSLVYILVGALGGNLAGALIEKLSLGFLLSTLIGMIGGFLGAEAMVFSGLLQRKALISSILSSTAGGALLVTLVGYCRLYFSSSK